MDDDEILSRLRKALTSSKYALDSTQLEVALGGVERLLANNLRQFNTIFAPFVMPAPDPRIEQLIKQNHEVMIENERLKFQMAQRPPPPPPAAPRVQPVAKTKPVVERSADRYDWTPQVYQRALQMLLDGGTGSHVAEQLGLRPNQVWGRFWGRGVDETLLSAPVEVQRDGPMSFVELWKIGFALWGNSWRTEIERLFTLDKTIHIHCKAPANVLTADQIQTLRNYWFDRSLVPQRKAGRYHLNANATIVLNAVRNAGPDGLTEAEMRALVPKGAGMRRYELVKQRLIFDSQRRGGDTGRATLWVASEYRDIYPAAWRTAEQAQDAAIHDAIDNYSLPL